ncbi:MAG: DUF4491 family protein [Clostridia bacterium]|nr:DUF4491 family protein [Clostridia bacterium]
MNYTGLLIGLVSFLTIGVFHPIVIKSEYYFSKKIWPLFLVGGIVFCVLSAVVKGTVLSCVFAVVGFSMFWSIKELFEQEKRVQKGWFPQNPKRVPPATKEKETVHQ